MIQKATRLNDVQEYYFSKKLREVAELKKTGKPVINIAIGSPDLQPPVAVVEAMKKATALKNANKYQSYQGIPELRKGMASFYSKNYAVELNPDTELLPLMGSKEGIMHISMAYLNKGDRVLIPNPGYPTYASVTKLLEAVPVFYDLKEKSNWMPDLQKLEEQDLSNVKIMWINYPHMPTGAKASKSFLAALIAFAKKHEILIVNDNPYSFILNKAPQSILEFKEARGVAIELNSLSKTFNMAGWRVGMVAGDAAIIRTVLQVKSNMDSGMFLPVQHGAIEALNMSNNWFAELNTIYNKRREIVWRIFDALNCKYDTQSGGLFVWAKLPAGRQSGEFTDELLYTKNVFITPGTVFGSNGEGFIRASLCVNETELLEVLDRITK